MKVELKVRESISGHFVEFTIENQTFKTMTFTAKGAEGRAKDYKKELENALKKIANAKT